MKQEKQDMLYPDEIILEVTNQCNLKCRYCHFHGSSVIKKRSVGHMDPGIWEKVLEELKDWPKPVTLMTHGAGEPLLYKELYDLLFQAGQIPHLTMGFMCNGMLLDKKHASKLIDLNLNWLALSIDGTNYKTHDYFRVNADLKRIETNLMNLIEEKKRRKSDFPVLNFNMVGYSEILDQAEDYVKKWLPHASAVTIAKFRPVGSRMLWNDMPPCNFRPCPLMYRQMVISYDGYVGLCCEDIHLEVPLGNVMDNSLAEIYTNSLKMKEYRFFHENADIKNLILCSDCHVWGGDCVIETEKTKLGDMMVEKTITPAFEMYRKIETI